MRLSVQCLAIALAASLCGCAATVTFVDRTNGNEYVGHTGGTGASHGALSAQIDGSDYTGHWIYSASGGGYSLGTGFGVANGVAAVGSASALAISAQGNGLIDMRDAGSRFIRCVFSFNAFSNTGIGECQRNDGRLYDLRIRRR